MELQGIDLFNLCMLIGVAFMVWCIRDATQTTQLHQERNARRRLRWHKVSRARGDEV